jgi:hypothetical protein
VRKAEQRILKQDNSLLFFYPLSATQIQEAALPRAVSARARFCGILVAGSSPGKLKLGKPSACD